MPPKRSKRIAEKSGQADQQPAAALTPEEISAALAQLLEGQRQTQQQIEALLAQQPGGNRRDRGQGASGAIGGHLGPIDKPRPILAGLETPGKILTIGGLPEKRGMTRLPGGQPRDARPGTVTTSGTQSTNDAARPSTTVRPTKKKRDLPLIPPTARRM